LTDRGIALIIAAPVRRKILIVDDDVETREGLAILLAGTGYQTIAVGTVPEALQALAEADPDLLLTDIRVASRNGLHLIAMAPKPIPAIVMTGFVDSRLEAEAHSLGADYMVKPVSPMVLCSLIERKFADSDSIGAMVTTRRLGRRRVPKEIPVRLGAQAGRILDVSDVGIGLEVDASPDDELPASVTIDVIPGGISVPVAITWTRRDATTWRCGGVVRPESLRRWLKFVQTLF
jgi:CheY-like chemotaxis protein